MAYLTCPDCMMPNPVGDDAVKYACFSCFAQIIFETCPDCSYPAGDPVAMAAGVHLRSLLAAGEIPRERFFATSTKAREVEGLGYTYPRT